MTSTRTSEWVAHARKFIATDDCTFLERAVETCSDHSVRDLLQRPGTADCLLTPGDWGDLVAHLSEQRRTVESAAVQLIGLRGYLLLAAHPERLDEDQRSIALEFCAHMMTACQKHDFAECEARVAWTLGTGAGRLRKWKEARALLLHALTIYRRLALSEPDVYLPYLATTLANLGGVMGEEGDWTPAQHVIEEALAVRRVLAESGARSHRCQVASTLCNLAIVLRHNHDLSSARCALEEALQIYGWVSGTEPRAYSGEIAGALVGLGNVLLEDRAFSAARGAFHEALAIYRALAKEERDTYCPKVATTLSDLGNVLREERDLPGARRVFDESLGILRPLAVADPQKYGPDVARTSNNLAALLLDQRNLPAAREVFEEALGIYRELDSREPRIHQHDLAAALANVSAVCREQGDLVVAWRASKEAAEICMALAARERDAYQQDFARALNNLAAVLIDRREFPAARRALLEAVEIYRTRAEAEPHIYQPLVAKTLHNLGEVLVEERDYEAATSAFAEALDISRALAEDQQGIYDSDVAATCNALGTVLLRKGDHPSARRAIEEGLDIYRQLAGPEPRIYQRELAGTLHNLGNVLAEQRDFPAARQVFEEAVQIHLSLEKTEPRIYKARIAATLNNLGDVLAELDATDAALDVSRRAVEAAENSGTDPDQLWLAKGKCPSAYARIGVDLLETNERDGIFRCLASMREGEIRAFGTKPEFGLTAAAKSLAQVGRKIGRPVCIVIAQNLTDSGMLVAVLDGIGPDFMRCYRADSFRDVGRSLFVEIASVFDSSEDRDWNAHRATVKTLGSRAWRALPAAVRDALDPNAAHDVLISGDPFWAAFPWEALRCGDGEASWLGLHRTLARWCSLTAKSTGELGRRLIGEGARTAGVLCPWNATSDSRNHLPHAREEAEAVAAELTAQGYNLVPGGIAHLGQAANAPATDQVLIKTPSVIHYAGHGTSIGEEEVLVLYGEDAEHPHTYYGCTELRNLKSRLGVGGKLLRQRPLVVLNCCHVGRTHEFGGQREDLVWRFLFEGAEAVIASALPIFDIIGVIAGESIYSRWFRSADGMGQTLVAVRRTLERATRKHLSRMWPAWTLITYHGNPYAILPQGPDSSDSLADSTSTRLFDRLASGLGLRDHSEVLELIADAQSW